MESLYRRRYAALVYERLARFLRKIMREDYARTPLAVGGTWAFVLDFPVIYRALTGCRALWRDF
jgi:hypothetical protein